MRRMVSGALVALTLILLLGSPARAQDEDFEPGQDNHLSWVSYDEAVSQAKTKYKPVMLYFYGDEGKDLCRLAETKIFKKSSLKTQAKKFAVVKLSSATEEKLTDKFSVPPGEFTIILTNFQLKEITKITSEKDLKKLSTFMKKAYKENSNQSKTLKKVADYYKKAMKYKDAKRVRDCVKILEAIAALRGKVDSPYIKKADDYLKQLEKAGAAALSEAEGLINQAESSLRQAQRHGSRHFRQEYLNNAQQKLSLIAQNYPVQSLMKRRTNAQARLAQISAEYQRLIQQEQEQDQDP